jgi:hypothetical protein
MDGSLFVFLVVFINLGDMEIISIYLLHVPVVDLSFGKGSTMIQMNWGQTQLIGCIYHSHKY